MHRHGLRAPKALPLRRRRPDCLRAGGDLRGVRLRTGGRGGLWLHRLPAELRELRATAVLRLCARTGNLRGRLRRLLLSGPDERNPRPSLPRRWLACVAARGGPRRGAGRLHAAHSELQRGRRAAGGGAGESRRERDAEELPLQAPGRVHGHGGRPSDRGRVRRRRAGCLRPGHHRRRLWLRLLRAGLVRLRPGLRPRPRVRLRAAAVLRSRAVVRAAGELRTGARPLVRLRHGSELRLRALLRLRPLVWIGAVVRLVSFVRQRVRQLRRGLRRRLWRLLVTRPAAT